MNLSEIVKSAVVKRSLENVPKGKIVIRPMAFNLDAKTSELLVFIEGQTYSIKWDARGGTELGNNND